MLQDAGLTSRLSSVRQWYNGYHFGKQEGFDLWCEADKCSNVIVIGEGPYRNVFYEPYGAVHNEKEQLTEDAVIIYDNTNKKWLFDGEVIGNANIQ